VITVNCLVKPLTIRATILASEGHVVAEDLQNTAGQVAVHSQKGCTATWKVLLGIQNVRAQPLCCKQDPRVSCCQAAEVPGSDVVQAACFLCTRVQPDLNSDTTTTTTTTTTTKTAPKDTVERHDRTLQPVRFNAAYLGVTVEGVTAILTAQLACNRREASKQERRQWAQICKGTCSSTTKEACTAAMKPASLAMAGSLHAQTVCSKQGMWRPQ
jgi:hypothetical protein